MVAGHRDSPSFFFFPQLLNIYSSRKKKQVTTLLFRPTTRHLFHLLGPNARRYQHAHTDKEFGSEQPLPMSYTHGGAQVREKKMRFDLFLFIKKKKSLIFHAVGRAEK